MVECRSDAEQWGTKRVSYLKGVVRYGSVEGGGEKLVSPYNLHVLVDSNICTFCVSGLLLGSRPPIRSSEWMFSVYKMGSGRVQFYREAGESTNSNVRI